MTDALTHRGPDDRGTLNDRHVALGSRRLAILDLSEAGHQPMQTEDGRLGLVYNGEVYNFRELRAELEVEGAVFRSSSDTEVVLHAYAKWGPEAIKRFNGMFALAVWDSRENTLFLARDRYGVKPLYYWQGRDTLLFASEVKGLTAVPDLAASVDLKALREYFTFQNVYTDRTLFEGVRILPPGHWARVADGGRELTIERYWDFDFGTVHEMDAQECAAELRNLFESSVSRQLVSDVALGSFLSGGMDSGSIVAVASRLVPQLQTYTGGFDMRAADGIESTFDERDEARRLAQRFETDHHELEMGPGDMQRVLPDLIWHVEDLRVGMCWQDYYLEKLASDFGKVVLSGAGGDELFGGYTWRLQRIADVEAENEFDQIYYDYWQRVVPAARHSAFFRPNVMSSTPGYSPRDSFQSVFRGFQGATFVDRALYFDLKTFLPGLLAVIDKIAMAFSIEARVPFLDNDLVNFAQQIPSGMKVGAAKDPEWLDENLTGHKHLYLRSTNLGKQILREAMRGLVPDATILGNKQGFSPPDGSWYRKRTMSYIRETLLSSSSRAEGFILPDAIASVLDEHERGEKNHRLLLWSLLSFEWWLRRFL